MAKAELAPPSNRLFIPGSEAVEVGGVRRIGPNSVRRVERAAHHYMKYRDQFKRRGAFILCSGGYSGSAHGQEAPVDRSQREARLLAKQLRDEYDIPSHLIEEEDESTSAFSNVANSILGGWVEPTAFNAEDRLGVVAPPLFQKRLQIIWSKVNIGREAIEPICDNENMSFATELAGRLITRYLLRSATEPADLLQAEVRFNQLPIAGRSGNTA